jgi:hypothetical protein
MKKDIVLHSLDPYLLMRMFTDLQMDGRFDDDLGWNEYNHPFGKVLPVDNFLNIEYQGMSIAFFCHECGLNPILLTESNYLSTLKMILE